MRTTQAVKRIKEIDKEINELQSNNPTPPGVKVYMIRNFYTDTLFEQLCTGKIDPELFLDRNKINVEKFKVIGECFLELYDFYTQKADIDKRIEELELEKSVLEKQVFG